jgi:hypothetical protein
VHEVSRDQVNREFHIRAARKCLEKFKYTFQAHLVDQYTNGSKTHYLLGADKEFAYFLARILVDCKDELNGEERADDEWYSLPLPDKEITLGDQHTMSQGPVKCNLKQTMQVLTDEVEFESVLEKPFVVQFWDQIVLLATQEEAVDIWLDDRFEELRVAVIKYLLPHPIHQQFAERMVQAAALVSQTGRGEDRRTSEAVALTSIVRPANAAALAARNQTREQEGKKKVSQVQGRFKVGVTLDFVDAFLKEAERAKRKLGASEFDRLVEDFGSNKKKQSAAKRAKEMERFEKALYQPRKINKAEKPLGHDVTATMGGGILLRILTQKNDKLGWAVIAAVR